LARPQVAEETSARREGIAIMLVIDCSSTMLAEDLQLGSLGLVKLVEEAGPQRRLNRLDAVKKVARAFIDGRDNDMIGIVAFAAQAYIICPPTFDREWLANNLSRIRIGMIKDATAIGSGILSGLSALRSVKARSKVMVLLTDGINNFGEVPPLVAAKTARAMGVKIYTIGIASKGLSPYPAKDAYGNKTYKNVKIDIDEDMLRNMADITGGSYYKATDLSALKKSYDDIDRLEKGDLEQSAYEEYKDIFSIFLRLALLCLAVDILLGNTLLRKIP
jgi:Ca-activated chloride channel family protein